MRCMYYLDKPMSPATFLDLTGYPWHEPQGSKYHQVVCVSLFLSRIFPWRGPRTMIGYFYRIRDDVQYARAVSSATMETALLLLLFAPSSVLTSLFQPTPSTLSRSARMATATTAACVCVDAYGLWGRCGDPLAIPSARQVLPQQRSRINAFAVRKLFQGGHCNPFSDHCIQFFGHCNLPVATISCHLR